ncbi:hypothetical protein Tco_0682032 [Tanacetum coccineum]|uniref:Uncharacterized protein n=1 Tax=Tanacetum coccineum TaxID=301880 RepID=A0ABQ4XQ22_9ASTR
MELFVTNSQKMPNLPREELQWSLASTSPEVESTTTKKFGKNLSWPPVHWKITPGFDKTRLDVAKGLFKRNGGDWIIDENPASLMPLVILEDDEALNDQSDSVIDKWYGNQCDAYYFIDDELPSDYYKYEMYNLMQQAGSRNKEKHLTDNTQIAEMENDYAYC